VKRAVIAAALTVLALAPAATADRAGSGSRLAFGADGRGNQPPVSFSSLNVSARVTGDLVVHFHGDPATGCAARELCRYSGTIIWTPAQPATLSLMATKTRGGTSYSVDLGLAQDSLVTNGGGTTDGSATSAGGSNCADAAYTGSDLPFTVSRGRARVTLTDASPSLLQTRCAGPLAGDLASALPSASVPLSTLTRGQTQIPLERDRSFAANGFAGTVSSTLSISLGRPGRWQTQRLKPQRLHTLTLAYRATLTGDLTAAVSGDADEGLCGPLGACGASGTESLAPKAVGQAQFEAIARAKHRYAQLRQALRTGIAPRGVQLYGHMTWPGGGRITANLHSPSGTCTDHTGLGGADVFAVLGRRRMSLQFSIGAYTEAFRTRCPGPFAPQNSFATGDAPVSILRRPTAIIRLTGTPAFRDDGYTSRLTSTLTITLSHRRIRRMGGGLLTTVAN
jgi:hypothetical protein